MRRLLETNHFRNSRRYPALLRFIVEETLAGRSAHLKERFLGLHISVGLRTLRALVEDGFVLRTVLATKPPKVEYRLTTVGREIARGCRRSPLTSRQTLLRSWRIEQERRRR
jgi:DNA-binding PadR family transcriptional regulator